MKSGVRKKSVDQFWIRAIVFAFAILCCVSFDVHAQSAKELYMQAGESYNAKQFPEAAGKYEQLLSQGYKNAEVYYNLGSCYYKMDSIGKCILNYERALKLSPNDEDIQHNLKIARLKPIDNISPVPQLGIITWWNNFVSFNTSNGWGILAVVSVWLCMLIFAASFLFGRRRIFSIFILLFLFLSFSSLALAIQQQKLQGRSDAAIVMVSSAYVKSAPDAGASDLFMIHEGTRLQILDQVGEWNKIRLEDGKVGWMMAGNFERI
ncbi:MAG TPA: tetratricopeptide repeat protein [Chitinophagales bacterium]|nr:tetratricopeptide repeat protein [Chitinophagales bacterium]